jgi:hypothetical protein
MRVTKKPTIRFVEGVASKAAPFSFALQKTGVPALDFLQYLRHFTAGSLIRPLLASG